MVYAIITTKGHQFKVREKQTIVVNKLKNKINSLISFPILLIGNDKENVTKIDKKDILHIRVIAKLLKNVCSPKIKIQKFKNKTGYKKRQGHRQKLSVLKILKIKY